MKQSMVAKGVMSLSPQQRAGGLFFRQACDTVLAAVATTPGHLGAAEE